AAAPIGAHPPPPPRQPVSEPRGMNAVASPASSPISKPVSAPVSRPPPGPKPASNPAPSGSTARFVANYDPAELDEPVDLPPDQKKKILDLFYTLDQRNYYELLGVPRSADKKVIKAAYYGFASTVHPDRFFRKNLGSFKLKMEAIFGKVTVA